jgi:hypothetical protein
MFNVPAKQNSRIERIIAKETWHEYDPIKSFMVNETGTYPITGLCDDAKGI